VRTRIQRYKVDLALVFVAVIWGLTFPVVKDAVAEYPTFSFLTVRFAIASVAFALIFPRSLRKFSWNAVRAGIVAGVFISLGYIFQTLGLELTGATRAGFITGMAVVMTPILQVIVLRKIPHIYSLGGVALATAGLWLLSADSAGGGWNSGDTLVLIGAVCFACHWIVLGKVSASHPVDVLTLVQLMVASAMAGVMTLFTEPLVAPSGTALWGSLLLTGVLASAVAFGIQTYALRHISPTRVALIIINEPVFAGVFGFLLLGEVLGVEGWIGSGFILGGMLLSEVLGNRRRSKEPLPLEV